MSGIYIEGMGLPDNDEVIALFVYPNGDVRLWRPPSAIGQQYTAVPVPDHGDLVDLNEAADAVCCCDGDVWLDTKQIHIVLPAEEGEG